jgi:hypothetical protein
MGEAKRPRGIKFGPGEYRFVEVDGKTQAIGSIDGISRLLIELGAQGSVDDLNRLERQRETMREDLTREEWRRFQEAVAIARADLETKT